VRVTTWDRSLVTVLNAGECLLVEGKTSVYRNQVGIITNQARIANLSNQQALQLCLDNQEKIDINELHFQNSEPNQIDDLKKAKRGMLDESFKGDPQVIITPEVAVDIQKWAFQPKSSPVSIDVQVPSNVIEKLTGQTSADLSKERVKEKERKSEKLCVG